MRYQRTLLVLQAAATEVDHLDGAFGGMLEQDVLRFKITVHYAVMAHEAEREEHLVREAPNKGGGESDEAICLDKFVKVHAEELHRNTKVTTEVEVFDHLDDLVLILRVLKQRISIQHVRQRQ
jgi:hypothetical protein